MRKTTAKAVGLRLGCDGRTSWCDFSKWSVMAGKLDWSIVDPNEAYSVQIQYDDDTFQTLCIVAGSEADYTTAKVCIDHGVVPRVTRTISRDEVIPTVRIFVSVAVGQNLVEAPNGRPIAGVMTIIPEVESQ